MPTTQDSASITVGDLSVTVEVAHSALRGIHLQGRPSVTDFPFMRRVLQNARLQELLKDSRYRILSFQFLESGEKRDEEAVSAKFKAVAYDYTRNRAVVVHSSIDNPDVIDVTTRLEQPLPTWEEFQEAVDRIKQDPTLGTAVREGHLIPYQPMPPLLTREGSEQATDRILAVGLRPTTPREKHQIVGVNLANGSVVTFPIGHPPGSLTEEGVCGLADANQPTAMAVPGMVKITVSKAGKTLWTLDAVRPASSSGTRGSGVELRLVNYKGKRVLYRGHVPILTVRYDNDACGPYRDWQNEEGAIVAPDGADIGTTGFRLCNSPAKTMLDTGSDQGDHLGPAIYIDGEDVVIVSEMEAGWYRYISEWRLHSDGTIQPRFGFSAVSNSCVCHAHHHHAYWRLDFDIETAGNNLVEEFNRKLWIPPQPSGTWTPLEYETKRVRFPIFARKWRVRNATTNAAYEIIPGATDGAADSAFGVGDFWAVRYRSDEIDDGVNITRDPNLDAASNASKLLAHIDNFVTGESIENTDVVVWYAAHFTHDFHENEVGHIVGPILKPSNWS